MTDFIADPNRDTPALPPPPPPSSTLHRIFIGPDGLRAGWSLLIASALVFFLFPGATFLLRQSHLIPPPALEHTPGPLPVLLSEGVAFLVVALVTWIMSKIERRPVSVYGLDGKRKFPHVLVGSFWGILFVSLLVLLLNKSGLLVFDNRLLFGNDIVCYALAWIPPILAISLFEEYLFRGYLQYTLTRGLAGFYRHLFKTPNHQALGFWTAAVLVSVGFGAVHGSNPGESPLGLVCAALASLVFCLSLWRTGSLWWAIGLHTGWDWAQSYLYGVGDSGAYFRYRLFANHPVGKPILSGGVTGPEGSLFALPGLLLLALIIIFTLPRAPQLADDVNELRTTEA